MEDYLAIDLQHIEYHGEFYTTPHYWECECDDVFLHPNTSTGCLACGSMAEDSPDARVEDVLRYVSPVNEPWANILEEVFLDGRLTTKYIDIIRELIEDGKSV